MPLFGQELFIDAEKKGPLTTPAYRKAREACIRLARKEGIDAVMDKHKLDALVAPTQGPAWLIDWVNGDYSSGGMQHAGGGGRLSARDRADGAGARVAGGPELLRAGVERVAAARARLRLRAGHARPEAADVRRRARRFPAV